MQTARVIRAHFLNWLSSTAAFGDLVHARADLVVGVVCQRL
jgi:hypothetical protein